MKMGSFEFCRNSPTAYFQATGVNPPYYEVSRRLETFTMAEIIRQFYPVRSGSFATTLAPFARWLSRTVLLVSLGFCGSLPDAAAADNAPALNALKKLSVEQLMEIEVTSVSRRPEKLLQAAAAVQVISGEEIRRSGATLLPEALRLADNLAAAQKNSHDWGISARGFNTELANKLLVMMDGRTVYTPLYSGVFWNVQDYLLEDLNRIEVISGPGGTLWGANAVNGVINIISKSARDTTGLFAEAGAGGNIRSFVGARYGAALAPNVHVRIYGKYFDRGSQVMTNGLKAANAWHMGRGGFRLDAEPSAQNTLTLQGDLYGGDQNLNAGGSSEVSGGNVLGRWSHIISEHSDFRLQAYYDRTHLASVVRTHTFAPAGILTDDLDTYDVDFQHRLQLGDRHQLVWGLGYRLTHDEVTNAPTLVFLPAHLEQSLFSGFAQDEITLRPGLLFTIGTKLEHNDYTGYEVEPSARLQWELTARQMVWTALSRAVRTPSRIDRDLREPTLLAAPLPSSILNGGANFRAETVVVAELGYRAQLSERLSTSATVFVHDYDHVRSTTPAPMTPTSFGFPLTFENNLEGETHGLELSSALQVRPGWRLRAGFNLLKEYLHVKSGRVDFSRALNETADPERQLTLRSAMDLPGRVELDVAWRAVDALRVNNGGTEGRVPGYYEMDARLGWRPTDQLELALVGQNLLHDHHPEFGMGRPTREEIERSVHGKVSWRF
jgi:iron complex outermembrane receptor protein